MDLALVSELLAASLRMGTPLLLLGLAEMLCERSGIVNVGLEGLLLAGCFGAVAGATLTGSVTGGLILAIFGASVLLMLFAVLTVVLELDQILSGTAVNLLAFGLTGFLYHSLYGVTGAALVLPSFSMYSSSILESVPWIGPALNGQPLLTWAALLLAPALAVFLRHTLPGLALDAAGQLPEAVHAAGLDVARIRFCALTGAGVLAGMAGAHLALVQAHGFVEGMSAGRGFLALAIVIFGRWSPLGVLGSSLFFGLAFAAQHHLQASGSEIPYQFIRCLPYVLTLGVLAAAGSGSRKAPAGLGRRIQSGE